MTLKSLINKFLQTKAISQACNKEKEFQVIKPNNIDKKANRALMMKTHHNTKEEGLNFQEDSKREMVAHLMLMGMKGTRVEGLSNIDEVIGEIL